MISQSEGQPQQEAMDDYEFWPRAMLPAWFVTDSKLVVRNTNKLADDLVKTFGIQDCSTNTFIPLELDDSRASPVASLLYCIVDPHYQNNITYLQATSEILREHLTILERFNQAGVSRRPEYLIEKLRTVRDREGVKPYVPSMDLESNELRMGVKISPPQGLKLVQPAEIEYANVEFVDVVMAYRISLSWSVPARGLLERVTFHGVQPAIHDATDRHRMWEKSKEEEEAKITQFLSHALKTPLANTQNILSSIKLPGLDPVVREEKLLELESIVSDVGHLVELLLFINTVEQNIVAPVRMIELSESVPWACFTRKDVENVVAGALQSVHNRRTRNQADVEKVEALFEGKDMPIPSHEADGIGIGAFKSLAQRIITVDLIDPRQVFAIVPFVESGNRESARLSEQAKTVLLNLLLVELIVNAVKNADENVPEIAVTLRLDRIHSCLEILIFNNGAELDPELERRGIETKFHGEKRRMLGRLLNQKAARALSWTLELQQPPAKGTLFVITIPLER